MRDDSSRDYTRYEISRKFWNDFLKCRIKFAGNFVLTKFSDRFGIGALGLYFEICRKFLGNFGVIEKHFFVFFYKISIF